MGNSSIIAIILAILAALIVFGTIIIFLTGSFHYGTPTARPLKVK